MPLSSWSQGAAAAPDITYVFKVGGKRKVVKGRKVGPSVVIPFHPKSKTSGSLQQTKISLARTGYF